MSSIISEYDSQNIESEVKKDNKNKEKSLSVRNENIAFYRQNRYNTTDLRLLS